MKETDALVKAIKELDVKVVLVIDNERLENAISNRVGNEVKIIRVPKSSGISASR